jgi:multidrug efflux pump subunit AcrA (membrane-fusion protein)
MSDLQQQLEAAQQQLQAAQQQAQQAQLAAAAAQRQAELVAAVTVRRGTHVWKGVESLAGLGRGCTCCRAAAELTEMDAKC